jgi:hypothetical protein
MAKIWFSRWPPVGHKIGQSRKSKKGLGVLAKGILTPSLIDVSAYIPSLFGNVGGVHARLNSHEPLFILS